MKQQITRLRLMINPPTRTRVVFIPKLIHKLTLFLCIAHSHLRVAEHTRRNTSASSGKVS